MERYFRKEGHFFTMNRSMLTETLVSVKPMSNPHTAY